MLVTMRREEEDDNQQTRVFYELSAMIVHLLRPPPLPSPFPQTFGSSSSVTPSSSSSLSSRPSHFSSPAAFASLFLGISLALMLLGSVTFVIGFILMPWVVGLALLFYFAGIVYSLSELGRSILCSSSSSPNHLPAAWKFS